MHRLVAGAAMALALTAQVASAESFTFVAIGDMPYKLPNDYSRFERLIGAINQIRPAFTVHVGDFKSVRTPCTDENFEKIKGYFETFEQPLIYTPGDNEWTDCHREEAGKFDPLERLGKLRAMFFMAPESLGQTKLTVERQSDLMPEHKEHVENLRWTRDGVVFATVNIPGSNNGFERNEAMADEFFKRDAANVAWINAAFNKAVETHAPVMVFAFQADLLFQVDPTGPLAYANSGYKNTLAAFAKGAEVFKKPVLLIQGDLHAFIVDQPLKAGDGKSVLQNVFRLQVFGGEGNVKAVRITVDIDDPGAFGFQPLIVHENL
jgi:hypothetical protein